MPPTYISASNTFSFDYPNDWKVEEEDGGALALRKKGGLLKKESENVFRITPKVSDQVISPEAYTALLNLRKKEHRDLEVLEKSDRYTMNFHILKYRTESYQDIGKRTFLFSNDYWELIISNRIFTCAFSTRQEEAASTQTLAEKETAEQILYTLKLL